MELMNKTGIVATVLLWMILATACRSGTRTESEVSTRIGRREALLRGLRHQRLPLAAVIPREVMDLVVVRHFGAIALSLQRAGVRELVPFTTATRTRGCFFTATSLTELSRCGVDVEAPVALFHLAGRAAQAAAIVRLANVAAFVDDYLSRFPRRTPKRVGDALLLVHSDSVHTIVRGGWAIMIESRRGDPSSARKLTQRLLHLPPAQSIGASPTYRQVVQKLGTAHDLFYFLEIGKTASKVSPGALQAGIRATLGPIGLSADIKGVSISGRFFVGVAQTSPIRGLFKVGAPSVGWRAFGSKPSASVSVQLDIEQALRRSVEIGHWFGWTQLDVALDTAWGLGPTPREMIRMLDGRIEINLTIGPTIATDSGAIDVSVLVKLRKPKPIRALLQRVVALHILPAVKRREGKQIWYSARIPELRKALNIGVVASDLVLTTDPSAIPRMASTTRLSFLAGLSIPQLGAMLRGRNALFGYLDFSALVAVAKANHGPRKRSMEWVELAETLRALAVNVDDLRDGCSGSIFLQLRARTTDEWLQKVSSYLTREIARTARLRHNR